MIGLDSHTVENRKVVLENDMIEQWSSVNKESDGLYAALARLLDEHEMDIQGFLGSDDVQEEYLEAVFYDMVEVLQYNSTSGIFWCWEMINPRRKNVNTMVSGAGF